MFVFWSQFDRLLLLKALLAASKHWFREWCGLIRQQAITWFSVDLDLQHHMMMLLVAKLTMSYKIGICMYPNWTPGPWFSIKMWYYQYRNSNNKDTMVSRQSYIYDENPYSLYRVRVRWHFYIESIHRCLSSWSSGMFYLVWYDMQLHPKVNFVYVPSQWEPTLQCNVASHWLGAYTKWSLHPMSPPLVVA